MVSFDPETSRLRSGTRQLQREASRCEFKKTSATELHKKEGNLGHRRIFRQEGIVMRYNQITLTERYTLGILRKQELSVAATARLTGRHRSTFWREFRRGTSAYDDAYRPTVAKGQQPPAGLAPAQTLRTRRVETRR